MPEKSFEKYLKQVDKLKEDIKFLKNNAPKNYTRILFALGENEKHDYFEKEIIGFEYNQDSLFYDENGYKWNVKNKRFLTFSTCFSTYARKKLYSNNFAVKLKGLLFVFGLYEE